MNTYPELKVILSFNFPCIKNIFSANIFWSLILVTDKTEGQKILMKSYKTGIKIHAISRLA